MLKSCKYCGRFHDTSIDCGMKPKKIKKRTDADRFRNTKLWQHKREEIRERDLHLCQVCVRNLYNTESEYNFTNLSVHHAVPIESDYDLRLCNDNLITLCSYHHELAESHKIPYEVIKGIIEEQESKQRTI